MIRRLISLPIIAVTALLCGCSGGSQTVDVDVIGKPESPFEQGQRLPLAGQLVKSATAEGLVGFDAAGRVIPAMADRWIVTDDGLSYIFRLRDGTWADGSELSGESVKIALERAIDGLSGTSFGQDLAAIDEVRAMAGRVVEIRLTHAAPDLLDMLAQPELGLLRKGTGTGALRLKREGPMALLTPVEPAKRGLPEAPGWIDRTLTIRLHALPVVAAIQRFAEGKAAIVLGGQIADYPLALDASGLARRALRIDPVSGLFGLAIVRGDGVLGTPEGREALAMAIDRDALARDLAIREWAPTSRVVTASAPGAPSSIGERWAGQDLSRRRAEASSRIAQWKARGGKLVTLRIALPTGPGTDFLFTRLLTDFSAIGLNVTRVAEGASADIRLLDAVARYPGVNWYFNELSCAAGRGLCNPLADQAAAQAAVTDDPAARAVLLTNAETQLTVANVFIPLGSPVRWSLVSEPGYGFAINARGLHPLSPMAMRPK
ncbi:MAG: ABC transporter substrate-binding protein [Novosphingobium sp.]